MISIDRKIYSIMQKIEILLSSLNEARLNRVDPMSLDEENFHELLDSLDGFKKWIRAVEENAIDRIMCGYDIPGYCVKSKKSRKIVDQEGAIAELESYCPELAQQCIRRQLVGLKELKRCLEDWEFDYMIVPHLGTSWSYSLKRCNPASE